MSNINLPTAKVNTSQANDISNFWLRISAFLKVRSTNTQTTYLGILKEWCLFLGAEPGSDAASKLMLAANDLHAVAYRSWLEKQPGQKPRLQQSHTNDTAIMQHTSKSAPRDGLQYTLSNSTIAKKFTVLRRIYRMLISSDFGLTINPFDTDRVPTPSRASGSKRPTEMINFELVKKIIDLPDPRNNKGIRDRTLLALLFGAGLRRSEVVNLRVGDLMHTSQGTGFLRLRSTKSKKDFDQALPSWATELASTLQKQRLSEGASKGDYLFISYRGPGGRYATRKKISSSGLYRLFLKYCQLAGANDYVSPHSARATAITRLLAEGFSHREVQEFSRHSSVQMVEVYDKRRISVDQSPAKQLKY